MWSYKTELSSFHYWILLDLMQSCADLGWMLQTFLFGHFSCTGSRWFWLPGSCWVTSSCFIGEGLHWLVLECLLSTFWQLGHYKASQKQSPSELSVLAKVGECSFPTFTGGEAQHQER